MEGGTFESLLRGTKRTQLLIWLAFTTEPFVYVVLSFIVSQGAISCAEQTAGPYLKWGFYLLACLFAVASLLIGRFLLSDRQIKARLEAGQLEMDGSSASRDLSAQEVQLLSVSHYYSTPMLVSWGLNSGVPIGGLILLFTSDDCRTILVLSALAVVLNLLAYPQLDAFVERARSLVEEGM
jgi:uncharacterized membrane protein